MKRLPTAIVMTATLVAILLTPNIATASPTNTTSIALTCDKNVDATVSFTLQPSQADATFLGSVTISCGPNSNVGRARNRTAIPTGTATPGWVVIDSWTDSTGTTTGDCPTGGPITYKASCTNSTGTGAQLVVR